MPNYELVQELELQNGAYQEALISKSQRERELQELQIQEQRLSNFNQNVDEIQNAIDQINTLVYADPVDNEIDTLTCRNVEYLLFSGYSARRFSADVQRRLRGCTEALAYLNERLAALGNPEPVRLVLKDIRKKLNKFRYVSSGSVKLLSNGEQHLLKFTMANVCVQPHKAFTELTALADPTINSYLKAIQGIGDQPSVLLPRLIFTVDLCDKKVSITLGRSKNPVRFGSWPHPHYHGSICLGSFSDAFAEAVDSYDIVGIVSVLRMWAGIATVAEDIWGTSFLEAYKIIAQHAVRSAGDTFQYFTSYAETLRCRVNYGGERLVQFIEHQDQPGAYDIILKNPERIEERRYVFNPHEL
jgi:hypothetical protein